MTAPITPNEIAAAKAVPDNVIKIINGQLYKYFPDPTRPVEVHIEDIMRELEKLGLSAQHARSLIDTDGIRTLYGQNDWTVWYEEPQGYGGEDFKPCLYFEKREK